VDLSCYSKRYLAASAGLLLCVLASVVMAACGLAMLALTPLVPGILAAELIRRWADDEPRH
jgi:hypothetical protein